MSLTQVTKKRGPRTTKGPANSKRSRKEDDLSIIMATQPLPTSTQRENPDNVFSTRIINSPIGKTKNFKIFSINDKISFVHNVIGANSRSESLMLPPEDYYSELSDTRQLIHTQEVNLDDNSTRFTSKVWKHLKLFEYTYIEAKTRVEHIESVAECKHCNKSEILMASQQI